MKYLFIILVFSTALFAKTLTSNDVHSLSILIKERMHYLLKYYDLDHQHSLIKEKKEISFTDLKPRHTWQKTYEILEKINIQRALHSLPRVEPVGIEASLSLDSSMVYEMNIRILAELEILTIRNNVKMPKFKKRIFKNKIYLDNYNVLVDISAALDELNRRSFTSEDVFAQTMRIYDDITIILNYMHIRDNSIPNNALVNTKPKDVFQTSFLVLDKIAKIQLDLGIKVSDFSEFKRENISASEIFTLTGLIIAELQTIKAYIGLSKSITPLAKVYKRKELKNVEQLMGWNLKRLQLVEAVYARGKVNE